MNSSIKSIRDNDKELVNVVIAKGGGAGIDRVQTVIRDEASVTLYGERQEVVEFSNVTNLSVLDLQAQAWLDDRSGLTQEVEVEYHHGLEDFDIELGDTVSVTSKGLDFYAALPVEEISRELDSTVLTLGTPKFSLLDAIYGDEEDEERKNTALGLPVPTGFVVSTASPGIRVTVFPGTNSRAEGVEIYANGTPGYEPSNNRRFYRGSDTNVRITNLTPGNLYYVKARAYDREGDFSDFTEEKAVVAGYVSGGDVDPGTIGREQIFPGGSIPTIVATLPTLPDADFPEGSMVFLLSDQRLYTNDNDVWKNVVNADDLIGQIIGDQIADGTIVTDKFAAKSITVDKLVITNFTNLIPDGTFELSPTTEQWVRGGSWIYDDTNPRSGTYNLQRTISNGTSAATTARGTFSVEPGQEFRVSFYRATTSDYTTSSAGAGVRLTFFDSDGTSLSNSGIYETSVTNDVYERTTDTVLVPALAAEALFEVVSFAQTGGTVRIDDVFCSQAYDGELIVDGAITTDKLEANSITTGKIAAGAVGADQIFANAVTAGKLNLSPAGLIADSAFLRDEYWSITDKGVGNETWELLPSTNAGVENFARLQSPVDVGATRITSPRFSAAEGDTFYYHAWCIEVVNTDDDLEFRVRFRDSDGVSLGDGAVDTFSSTTGWDVWAGVTTAAPADTATVEIFADVNGGMTVGTWGVAKFELSPGFSSNRVPNAAITFSRAERPDSAISFRSVSPDEEVLRLGNITSSPGVPTGTQYGLWGILGSGVYIQGAPKLIDSGTVTMSIDYGAVTAGEVYGDSDTVTILSSQDIPTGRKWLVIPTVRNPGTGGGLLRFWDVRGFNGTDIYDIPAGTGKDIQIYYQEAIEARDTLGSLTHSTFVYWTILEVEA